MITIAKQIEKLIPTVNPQVKVPLSIGLWSDKMILRWFQSNQRKEKKRGSKKISG